MPRLVLLTSKVKHGVHVRVFLWIQAGGAEWQQLSGTRPSKILSGRLDAELDRTTFLEGCHQVLPFHTFNSTCRAEQYVRAVKEATLDPARPDVYQALTCLQHRKLLKHHHGPVVRVCLH